MKIKQALLQSKPKPKTPQRISAPMRIALVLVFVVTASLAKDIYWGMRLGHQERAYQQTLSTLDTRFNALTDRHERLLTDDDYVEGLIRSTFKHARPGELVVPLNESGDDLITISLSED